MGVFHICIFLDLHKKRASRQGQECSFEVSDAGTHRHTPAKSLFFLQSPLQYLFRSYRKTEEPLGAAQGIILAMIIGYQFGLVEIDFSLFIHELFAYAHGFDFADKHIMAAQLQYLGDLTGQVNGAFSDGRGAEARDGNLGQLAFCKFIHVSA